MRELLDTRRKAGVCSEFTKKRRVTEVLADTFYWVALSNPNDARRREGVALDDIVGDAIIFTTDEVLVEFTIFFSADPWQRGPAVATVRRLPPDKCYGLVDCIPMQTMRRHELREVTHDRHSISKGFARSFAIFDDRIQTSGNYVLHEPSDQRGVGQGTDWTKLVRLQGRDHRAPREDAYAVIRNLL